MCYVRCNGCGEVFTSWEHAIHLKECMWRRLAAAYGLCQGIKEAIERKEKVPVYVR